MTFFFCMIVTSLAALACTPALVSLSPWRSRRLRATNDSVSDSVAEPIESRVKQTQIAVREVDPRQRRLLEISEIVQESEDVVSVYLTSVDGSELPDFRPGQHLIVERPASVSSMATSRCYTLSNGPQQKAWRITVRRISSAIEAKSVSGWIHRELKIGDRLRVRGPRGSFTLDKADAAKPVVFVAAGVGITPMASMLHEELSYARSRQKWLFYQVRTWDTAPLLQEMVSLIERSTACTAQIMASRDAAPSESPMKQAKLFAGKLDPFAMLESVGTNDFTMFLCGPGDWMLEMRQKMVAMGVPDSQIHDEAFGTPETASALLPPQSADSRDNQTQFKVAFESSGKEAIVCGEKGNLLTLAKEHSIHIPASCRAGNCGTCAVKLLRGTVKYLREPQAETIDGEILPCICLPTSDIGIQA